MKKTDNRWCHRLREAIEQAIDRISWEHTLTYEDVIGTLEMIKMDLYAKNIADYIDEQEDTDNGPSPNKDQD